MCLHIREERWSVIADLWGWYEKTSVPVGALIESSQRATIPYEAVRPGTRKAFPRVCDLPSCAPRGLAQIRKPTHISYSWLKREQKFCISFWPSCLNLWTLFRSYLRIQFGCEHSRCGTAAGMESCTDDSNAGRSCGSPNSHCSASPAPNGASYGS